MILSVAKSARGVVELTRPVNAVVAGVLTFAGAFVAIGSDVIGSVGPVLLAALVTVRATAAGNTIKDYFDIEIDQINNPDRPIPSRERVPRSPRAFGNRDIVHRSRVKRTLEAGRPNQERGESTRA